MALMDWGVTYIQTKEKFLHSCLIIEIKIMSYFGRNFEKGMKHIFYASLVIAGFVGWATIEFIIWLFSHVTISFN